MTGCYNAANNKTPRAESPTPMERLRVTRTHADGAVLRCAYHGLKAQGYVRTPFHGGRIAGVTEADVTAPTDPVSVEPMTECYDATRPKNTPHRPRVGGRNDWMLDPRSLVPPPTNASHHVAAIPPGSAP